MSVLIKDMDMPQEKDNFIEVMIFGDGRVIKTGQSVRSLEDGNSYYTPTTPEILYQASELPKKHGRLIDVDAFEVIAYKDTEGRENTFDEGVKWMAEQNDSAPTVIETEK